MFNHELLKMWESLKEGAINVAEAFVNSIIFRELSLSTEVDIYYLPNW